MEIENGRTRARAANARHSPESTMATSLQVTITLSPETVRALRQSGFVLYAYRAVQGPAGGTPLVWFQTSDFQMQNTIQWTEEYQAYASTTKVLGGAQFSSFAPYPIQVGQVLRLTDSADSGQVTTDGGTEGAISISNLTSASLTCGISQAFNGTGTPLCAFPLPANTVIQIVPVPKLLLVFGSPPVDQGVVVEQGSGPGILIDLAGASSRSVAFDVDAGWSWAGDAEWASIVSNESVISLLPKATA